MQLQCKLKLKILKILIEKNCSPADDIITIETDDGIKIDDTMLSKEKFGERLP